MIVTYEKAFAAPLRVASLRVRLAESYFADGAPPALGDVSARLFTPAPLPSRYLYETPTRIVDLHPAEDAIFGGLPKNTRYEIRRADGKDGVSASICFQPTARELDEFVEYYDRFAVARGLPEAQRSHVKGCTAAECFALSRCHDSQRETLAMHAYIYGRGRARLTHSASIARDVASRDARAAVGRANRLLHWEDMVAFRRAGFECYDMGGWYPGTQDTARLRINEFKASLGGVIAREWSSFDSHTLRGAIYLAGRDFRLRHTK